MTNDDLVAVFHNSNRIAIDSISSVSIINIDGTAYVFEKETRFKTPEIFDVNCYFSSKLFAHTDKRYTVYVILIRTTI